MKLHNYNIILDTNFTSSSSSSFINKHCNTFFRANLSVTNRMWWPKAIMINSVLFVVLFLFTTPALLLNNLEVLLSGAFDRIYNLVSVWASSIGILYCLMAAVLLHPFRYSLVSLGMGLRRDDIFSHCTNMV